MPPRIGPAQFIFNLVTGKAVGSTKSEVRKATQSTAMVPMGTPYAPMEMGPG